MAERGDAESTVDQSVGQPPEPARGPPGPLGLVVTGRRCVEVRWSDQHGAHARSVTGRAVLGAAATVDLQVSDPAVSRLHAELELRPDGLWVRDLDSRNGTYIDGIRVAHARLPEGRPLQVGGCVLSARTDVPQENIELWPAPSFGPLIGHSVAMRELFATLARVAATPSTVLIQGETGTGKELVASAIHQASPRAAGPFVIVDCGRMTESLIEDELFGHVRGAFTGAASARAGALELADGGTVFLDEIGELPPSLQTQLLRVLERRSVRRIGADAYKTVDVRFVAATHRDLRRMVNAGAFREDLYFRLAVLPVVVPPLRERPDDIPPLIRHFLPPGAAPLRPDELREVLARPFLGNARELRNFVERACAFGVARALAMTAPDERAEPLPAVPIDRPFKDVRDEWVSHVEREYLRRALERHGGNVSAVATAAGLDRSYVHELLRKHDLRPAAPRRTP